MPTTFVVLLIFLFAAIVACIWFTGAMFIVLTRDWPTANRNTPSGVNRVNPVQECDNGKKPSVD